MGGAAEFTFVLGPDEQIERQCILNLNRLDFRIEYCRAVGALAAVMRDARLVVANDCGPSHIVQGLCVPYIGVFIELNPEWFWARNNSRAVVPVAGGASINSITVKEYLRNAYSC